MIHRLIAVSLTLFAVILGSAAASAQPLPVCFVSSLVMTEEGHRIDFALVFARQVRNETQPDSAHGVDLHRACLLTNRIGFFEFALPAGYYEIRVESDGFATETRWIDVKPGDVVFVDPFVLVPGSRISGTILAADLVTPLPDMMVVASSADGSTFMAMSDADGRYTLEGLPEGTVTLTALGKGLEFSRTPPIHIESGATVAGVDLLAVSSPPLSDGETATGEIMGTVRFEANSAPVAGARLALADDRNFPVDLAERTTGTEGIFHLRGLSAGTYRLTVSREGYASSYIEDISVLENEVTDVSDILLREPVGELRGSVLGAKDSAPVAHALVVAVAGNIFQSAITDEKGSFILPHLPSGVFDVAAFAEGHALLTLTDVVVDKNVVARELTLLLEVASHEE